MTTVVDREAFRDTDKTTGNRWYIYPPTGQRLVSVTTGLGNTEGKQRYLVPWSARLAAEYAVDNLAGLAAVARTQGHDAAVTLAKKQAELIRGRKRDAGGYVHELTNGMLLAGCDHEILWLLLLQHQPLHFDIILRMSPVAQRIEIAEI